MASSAFPSKTVCLLFISSMSILLFLKNGAPFNDLLFFVVVSVIDCIWLFTLLMTSNPPIAPDGRKNVVGI